MLVCCINVSKEPCGLLVTCIDVLLRGCHTSTDVNGMLSFGLGELVHKKHLKPFVIKCIMVRKMF